MLHELTEHRKEQLLCHERDKLSIISQCGRFRDPIYCNFRYDIICESLGKFKQLGIDMQTLNEFQRQVRHVVYAWNSEYYDLKFGVNKIFNVYPLIIVMCKTEDDVVNAFKFARQYNINLSIRSGAHSMLGFSLCNGMVIDQSSRARIKVSTDYKLCEVQAGVLLGPLVDKLYKYKRTLTIGNCVNNGLTGFSTAGGIGSLMPIFGVCCDSIREARVLLANGQIVTANKREHKDLLWAISGAGIGNFGIVLSLTMKTHPIDKVWIYDIKFKLDKFKDLVHTWFKVIRDKSKEGSKLFTSELVGRNNGCVVAGYYLGRNKSDLLNILQPLLELTDTEIETERLPYIDAVRKASYRSARWLPFWKYVNGWVHKQLDEQGINILYNYLKTAGDTEYIMLDKAGGKMNVRKDTNGFPHRGNTAWWHAGAQWDMTNYLLD